MYKNGSLIGENVLDSAGNAKIDLNTIIPNDTSQVWETKADISANAKIGSKITMALPSIIFPTQPDFTFTKIPYGWSNEMTVVSGTSMQPSITSISPTSGAPGTTLTIYGKNLQDDCGKREERVCQLTISLGGYEIKRDRFVEFKVTWLHDRITLVVPPKAQTGEI